MLERRLDCCRAIKNNSNKRNPDVRSGMGAVRAEDIPKEKKKPNSLLFAIPFLAFPSRSCVSSLQSFDIYGTLLRMIKCIPYNGNLGLIFNIYKCSKNINSGRIIIKNKIKIMELHLKFFIAMSEALEVEIAKDEKGQRLRVVLTMPSCQQKRDRIKLNSIVRLHY